MSIVYCLSAQRAILATEIDTGGNLDSLSVMLYKNNLAPDQDTVLADLEECDFGGYARVTALAFGTPHNGPTGAAETVGAEASFVATSGTTPNTVYGWGLVKEGTPDVLIAAEAFADPVNIVKTGDGIAVIPVVRFGMEGTGLVA